MKTLAGFLMGFGTAFLILAAAGYATYLHYQPTITTYKTKIETLKEVTHSPQYTKTIEALEAATPYITKLADLLQKYGWTVGIQDLGKYIAYIPQATTFMKQLREIADITHDALEAIEATPTYLTAMAAAGLATVVAGIVLTRRHNRAETP